MSVIGAPLKARENEAHDRKCDQVRLATAFITGAETLPTSLDNRGILTNEEIQDDEGNMLQTIINEIKLAYADRFDEENRTLKQKHYFLEKEKKEIRQNRLARQEKRHINQNTEDPELTSVQV